MADKLDNAVRDIIKERDEWKSKAEHHEKVARDNWKIGEQFKKDIARLKNSVELKDLQILSKDYTITKLQEANDKLRKRNLWKRIWNLE